MVTSVQDRFRGLLIGTAVGDALGLPAEGIPKARARKMFKGPWRHRFLFGRGMVSDDTEHTCFVAQCLLAHPDDPDAFVRRLSWCLRWWLVGLPAGVGLATGRAIIRLWLGIRPPKSGVHSAGNGPAMRVAPIGAFFATDQAAIDEFTSRCTTITHSDPRALVGANAIARVAGWIVRDQLSARPDLGVFVDMLSSVGEDDEWRKSVAAIRAGLEDGVSVADFASRLGLGDGVTGYIYDTVPVVLFAWYRHFGSYEETVASVIECGGDTDTTAAIAGALSGLSVGESGIPRAWIDGIVEVPRSIGAIRRIADALDGGLAGTAASPVRYFWPALALRNALFLLTVLAHGLRRLLPPY